LGSRAATGWRHDRTGCWRITGMFVISSSDRAMSHRQTARKNRRALALARGIRTPHGAPQRHSHVDRQTGDITAAAAVPATDRVAPWAISGGGRGWLVTEGTHRDGVRRLTAALRARRERGVSDETANHTAWEYRSHGLMESLGKGTRPTITPAAVDPSGPPRRTGFSPQRAPDRPHQQHAG